jgi:hypothetical protein
VDPQKSRSQNNDNIFVPSEDDGVMGIEYNVIPEPDNGDESVLQLPQQDEAIESSQAKSDENLAQKAEVKENSEVKEKAPAVEADSPAEVKKLILEDQNKSALGGEVVKEKKVDEAKMQEKKPIDVIKEVERSVSTNEPVTLPVSAETVVENSKPKENESENLAEPEVVPEVVEMPSTASTQNADVSEVIVPDIVDIPVPDNIDVPLPENNTIISEN